ncbi:M18 family aminopeptidase [Corynebacterium renale]|uniref:M18 family aminopeptidase n=1 Tax=Corynebacterium renale TaxID=1724 RepID=UPI000DBE8101|nr:M18 family aminopeptidase [Corynebacterium renale]
MTYAPDDFVEFLKNSPSSFHAADNVARTLVDHGFSHEHRAQPWNASPGGHFVVVDGAVLAWWVPHELHTSPAFRIVGAHTDSPGFVLKPHPVNPAGSWGTVGVEVYGGPIIPSWFDRDLTVAGQVVLSDGSVHLARVDNALRIPHLAIHLDRSTEFAPNRQVDTTPIFTYASDATELLDDLAASVDTGLNGRDIAAHRLITCDSQAPAYVGQGGMLASGRLDNLTSVWAGLAALVNAVENDDAADDILVFAAFDHEEVGSQSPTGAAGPLLEEVLRRTARALGADAEEFEQMRARSTMISADAAHAVHPNHPEKHDPNHQPHFGSGPVTKINANQRYATTAPMVALWNEACSAAGVPNQMFVGRNDVPCGSTIGPISATRVGIQTLDVGVPLLSMHSARELVAISDVLQLGQALEAYWVR